MKKVKVYQADINTDYKFRPYEEAEGKLNKADYKVVFDGEIDFPEGKDEAEYLFELFNIGDRLEGYKGHSLSVSDIVDIEGEVLYCDDIGWKKLTDKEWGRKNTTNRTFETAAQEKLEELAEEFGIPVERARFEIWASLQREYDKEDIRNWLTDEGIDFNDETVEEVLNYLYDEQDANLGIWDNIKKAYDAYKGRA